MKTNATLSRRTFLQSTAAIAGISAGCGHSIDLGSALSPTYVDAHVHIWTPDIASYPLADGFAKEKDMKPASFTPDELFAHCRPQNVNRIVLIQMSFYQFDNRYMLDMIAKFPDTFRGVGIVDENAPGLPLTLETLHSKGVRGLRIYTNKDKAEAWGSSEGMKKLWALGAEMGISMCLLANPDALPAVANMCKSFPKTRVVIDHFARIGMKGPVQQQDLDNLCRLADHNTFVKTSAFYALGAKKAPYTDMAPVIHRLRDTFGANRLMWASDCPFQVQDGHTYADSIALIRDRLDFLTPDDKSWMLRKTAEQVFFA